MLILHIRYYCYNSKILPLKRKTFNFPVQDPIAKGRYYCESFLNLYFLFPLIELLFIKA